MRHEYLLLHSPSLPFEEDNKMVNSSSRITPKEATINYSTDEQNHWGVPHNQTFPKSNKQPRKQKRHSVQICQDPLHLYNVKDFQTNVPTTSSPLQAKKSKGMRFSHIGISSCVSIFKILILFYCYPYLLAMVRNISFPF